MTEQESEIIDWRNTRPTPEPATVTLDGVEVECFACLPGDNGWADVIDRDAIERWRRDSTLDEEWSLRTFGKVIVTRRGGLQ